MHNKNFDHPYRGCEFITPVCFLMLSLNFELKISSRVHNKDSMKCQEQDTKCGVTLKLVVPTSSTR